MSHLTDTKYGLFIMSAIRQHIYLFYIILIFFLILGLKPLKPLYNATLFSNCTVCKVEKVATFYMGCSHNIVQTTRLAY